jgi:LAO/AO transport system kinase
VDLERFLAGDERALARAISLIEAGRADGQRELQQVRVRAGRSRIVGITGSPGSGKSTLTDRLIEQARGRDMRVAVLAIDPSSPFSGGAILGDRIRMTRWHQDKSVYIRSMATRGHLGGLAAATLQVVVLLDAFGFDLILLETVGVGQSEVDIVRAADTTLLVLTPGAGDGVQAFKAGIMEIADIFVINKADVPGAERLKREIKAALELARPGEGDWWPPVLSSVATTGEGIGTLWEELDRHFQYLLDSNRYSEAQARRARFEIAAQLTAQLRLRLEAQSEVFISRVLAGEIALEDAIRQLFGNQTGV